MQFWLTKSPRPFKNCYEARLWSIDLPRIKPRHSYVLVCYNARRVKGDPKHFWHTTQLSRVPLNSQSTELLWGNALDYRFFTKKRSSLAVYGQHRHTYLLVFTTFGAWSKILLVPNATVTCVCEFTVYLWLYTWDSIGHTAMFLFLKWGVMILVLYLVTTV